MAKSRIETIDFVRSELGKLGNEELSGQFEAALIAWGNMAFKNVPKPKLYSGRQRDTPCRFLSKPLGRKAEACELPLRTINISRKLHG